ncbi:CopD family protein [uncultured Tateyamaria sp.]|uniref:CopD family protein n=1 Tax=uncultured Tateyamaria sp. TaxID=455651 RepID=UPI00260A1A44|nr:CopD family protein [uncultured Tateyamaria sp.]
MLYDLTKAAHLMSLFVWIGGMVAVALALRYPARIHLETLKTYDRAVTTPAMILALLFGIFLGAQGGWFTSTWLGVKLVLALGLSGLHGALVGKLSAIWESSSNATPNAGVFLPAGIMLLTLIILLVAVKPW